MNKLIHAIKFFSFIFLFASTSYAGHNFSVTYWASDYAIAVNYNELFANYCSCSNRDTRIVGARNSFGSGSHHFDFYISSSTTSGTYQHVVGPNSSNTYYITVYYSGESRNVSCLTPQSCSTYQNLNGAIGGATAPIKAPSSVTASNKASDSFIDISWNKGSDIPDGYLYYQIYRDNLNTLIAQVPGSIRSFRDLNVNPGETHVYYVVTYTPYWGGHTSSYSYAYGYTWGTGFTASDATDATRTTLKWNDLSSYTDKIEIERSSNGGASYEQLAVLDNKYVQYDDNNGIPGFTYLYRLKPSKSNVYYRFASDNGSKKPNGSINGYVKTRFGAGVPDVVVKATSDVNVFGTTQKVEYKVKTNAAGYYEINDVYYHQSANFTIVPSKGNHGFDPGNQSRTITLTVPFVDNVNFTDTTRLTVSGRLYFPVTGRDTCYIKDADIEVDGKPTNVKSDANGFYEVAMEKEGNHTIKPKFLNHTFSPSSRSLAVFDYVTKINFEDAQKDSLVISLKGGCKNVIADYATFRITSTSTQGCINKTVKTTPDGVYIEVLPAQKYKVELLDIVVNGRTNTNMLTYFTDPIEVDISKRDSNGTYAKAEFVYRSKPVVKVGQLPDSICIGNKFTFLLNQGSVYKFPIKVTENYSYKTLNVACDVDTGNVIITNEIGDKGTITLPIVKGLVDFSVKAGKPNIAGGSAHPYQKLLEVQAVVDNAKSDLKTHWFLIKGHSPRTQTFVTKTPELPFFVLHDPNGDQSYSFLEKDSSITYNYVNEYQVGGGAGPYLDLNIGAGIPVPFTGIVIGAATVINVNAEAGGDELHSNTVKTTFTSTKRFSTSGAESFVGGDGDVFVGASWNMIYALSDVVDYDPSRCAIIRDTSLAWGANGIATSYTYTEGHIKRTLLPQLRTLKSLAKGDSVRLIQTYIDVWEQVIRKNDENKKKALFVKNLSFSAGAPYDYQETSTEDSTTSYDYTAYLNINASIGAKIGDNSKFASTEFGIETKFRWSTRTAGGTTNGNSKTIGYHLEDNDPGDFYSVDVLTDRAYGTPVFKLSAGTSSCPHEKGAQYRDLPQISLDSYSLSNIPANQSGVFTANLSNLSESNENWTYNVKAISSSNLEGAIIRIGGEPVNSNPASFYIPSGKTASVVLSVEKGPVAADYEGLKVVMYSPCDPSVADTVTFSAHFQSECSNVDLYNPGDNWILNQNDNNKLNVTFSAYNSTNTNLKDIRLQYRKPGQPWNTVVTILKSLLTQKYFDYTFNTTALEDGEYELRAVANCGNSIGMNYSKVYKGRIDRKSIKLFGKPSPADGVLNLGEEISVEFNEAMNCDLQYDPTVVKLRIKDTKTVVPASFDCNGKSIVISLNPSTDLYKYEGKQLEALIYNMKDYNGNAIKDTIKWSFVVNQASLFWDPVNINKSIVLGTQDTIPVLLKNKAALEKSYQIDGLPSWLSVVPQSGAIPANGQVSVLLVVNKNLNAGTYTDTIIAQTDSIASNFYLNLKVSKSPAGWVVNPANYQHNMSVIAQFSPTDANSPLSTDVSDVVAAFVGNECRGVAHIEYLPASNSYVAYLSLYSNKTVGDSITFQFWDDSQGREYKAKEKIAFIKDATLGRTDNPYILHSEGTLIAVPFAKGWNWFSLNGKNTNMSPAKVLANLKANTKSIVKGQNEFVQYSSTGWIGSLSQFKTTNSYEIYLDQADTLKFWGNLSPDTSTSALLKGWNWVGYPGKTNVEINKVLSKTKAKDDDFVKSQTEFATYDAGQGLWNGNLKFFNPNKGYKYYSKDAKDIAFRLSATQSDYVVKPNDYEYNMTVCAQLSPKPTAVQNTFLTLGAFIDGRCHGVSQPTYVSSLDSFRVFMVVHGNSATLDRNVTFKVYNTYEEEEFTTTSPALLFNPDSSIGEIRNAYPIYVNETVGIDEELFEQGKVQLFQNAPNPFGDQTTLHYYLPESMSIKLSVVDVLGTEKVLLEETKGAGHHYLPVDALDYAAGIYTYRLKTVSKNLSKKFVVVK